MGTICCVVGGDPRSRPLMHQELLSAFSHRGERYASWHETGVSLGMRFCHDEVSWSNDEALLVIVNGYLVPIIRGQSMEESSGAAQLAAGWLIAGPAALDQFDGDYAACVFDRRSGDFFSICGPTVIQPLFRVAAGQRSGVVLLGQEIRPLLKVAQRDRTLDVEAIAQHLFYLGTLLSPEATPFEAAKRIPSGSFLHWTADSSAVPRQTDFWSAERAISECAADPCPVSLAEMRNVVTEAVLGSLPAEGETMLALSGGMDSSSIWGVIRDAARSDIVSAERVRAISFIYPGTASDEYEYIDENHRHWGTVGCYRDIAAERITDADESLLEDQDFPLSGSTAYHLPLLANDLAQGGVDTLLMGLSGDFWFRIPDVYPADLWKRGARARALKEALATPPGGGRSPTERLRRLLSRLIMPRGTGLRQWVRPVTPPSSMGGSVRQLSEQVEDWFADRSARFGVTRASVLYARECQWRSSFIPLTIVQMLGRRGVEVRDPLGSRRIMDWALRQPVWQLGSTLEKAPMRAAMSDVLPRRVRDKQVPTFHTGDQDLPHDPFRNLGDPGKWCLSQAGVLCPDYLRKQQRMGFTSLSPMIERMAMGELFARSCG